MGAQRMGAKFPSMGATIESSRSTRRLMSKLMEAKFPDFA